MEKKKHTRPPGKFERAFAFNNEKVRLTGCDLLVYSDFSLFRILIVYLICTLIFMYVYVCTSVYITKTLLCAELVSLHKIHHIPL